MRKTTVLGLMKKYRIRLKKELGQNFLIEKNLMDKLAEALELYPDEDLLEIGSGLGVFSNHLAKQSLEVLCIEKDKRLIDIARKEFGHQANLKFLEGDFLKLDLPHILKDYHLPIKVIGNIPYYITSPILFKILENRFLFQCAIVTVQKELARRLTAEPGNKDYGVPTILFQSQANLKILFELEPKCFLPPPEVSSSVLQILFPKEPPFQIQKPALLERVVKEAFRERRKQIKNTLKNLLKNNKINPWDPLNIDPQARPEQISVAQYVALANFLTTLI